MTHAAILAWGVEHADAFEARRGILTERQADTIAEAVEVPQELKQMVGGGPSLTDPWVTTTVLNRFRRGR